MKTVIEMAREAGWTNYDSQDERFQRFAELVRADEREACAKVVEEYPHWLGMTAKAEISNAIRNRNNK